MNHVTNLVPGSLEHVTSRNAPQGPLALTTADIGVWLEFETEALRQRRDDLIAALRACAASYPAIEDADIAGELAENIRMAAALGRTTEERRKAAKEPFLQGGKDVDTWFRRFCEPIQNAMAPVQSLLDDWGRRLEAERRAEAEAERRAAQAEADRLAAQAAAAIVSGTVDRAVLDRAADAAQAAEAADQLAGARSSELSRTRGIYGAVASLRESWSYEIMDLSIVPREYLTLNDAAIKAAMKAKDKRGQPMRAIPGIRWVRATKMGVR